jgi:hypothetical protein
MTNNIPAPALIDLLDALDSMRDATEHDLPDTHPAAPFIAAALDADDPRAAILAPYPNTTHARIIARLDAID